MTLTQLTSIKNWAGLSSDIKPTDGPPGSTFYETDTTDKYFWNGIAWNLNLDGVNTYQTNGVPVIYTKQTGSGRTEILKKGQTNLLVLRPQIINEQSESSGTVQDVIDATTIVGQIFKASKDNINGTTVTLESAAGASLDNFESYADTAALRVEWVKTGTNEANLETVIFKTGAKSMNIPLDVLNDEWADTFAAANYTDYSFSFDFYQTIIFSQAKVSFFLEDSSANTASIQLPISAILTWEHFDINVNALADDGVATDITDIVKVGFRVDTKRAVQDAYIDNIIATPPPGSVLFKLWDFGTTIPVSTVNGLDSAAQYTELGDRGRNGGVVAASISLQLTGGKKQYQLNEFVAGVAKEKAANTPLTIGNYYAITMHYVDTDVSVYGSDGSNGFYANGYSFTAANEVTPITAVGSDQDCMFIIYSTQDIYIITTFWSILTTGNTLATTGPSATHSVFLEDTMEDVEDVLVTTVKAGAGFLQTTDWRPMFMEDGGKYEMYYSDDYTDNAFSIQFAFGYLYIPAIPNG